MPTLHSQAENTQSLRQIFRECPMHPFAAPALAHLRKVMGQLMQGYPILCQPGRTGKLDKRPLSSICLIL